MNEDEQLDLLRWLLERYDSLRSSNSNRAAIVISADAFLLAGLTFLLDKSSGILSQSPQQERHIFILCVALNFLVLAVSVVFAAYAVVSVWRTSYVKPRLGTTPTRLFFYSADTANFLDSQANFDAKFKQTTKAEFVSFALSDLREVTESHYRRLANLKSAVRALLCSLVLFLLEGAIIFFR